MKILHLIAGELSGGAGRGAYWLHQAQRQLGIDSYIVTSGSDTLGDSSVVSLNDSMSQKIKFAVRNRLGNLPYKLYRNRKGNIFNTGFSGVNITKLPHYHDADVVHLHWINGLVSMKELSKVTKPIVWTMRDMWPLTGGCHYSMECDQYQNGCGACPQLGSRSQYDLSRLVANRKKAFIPKHIRLVGISEWLTYCATRSTVLCGLQVETIVNSVDCSQFFPVDKKVAKNILGLPEDKRIILAGSQRVNDFYKGFDLLVDSLKLLNKGSSHLVLFGKATEDDVHATGMDATNLGFLSDTIAMRLAYSAADVFVAPSRMEAFGKTLAEAMSCGTPVVCFDATGPKDIVTHKVTGYKAEPFNPQDMAAGINWVLDKSSQSFYELCQSARGRALSCFDAPVVARQYINLYKRMLN